MVKDKITGYLIDSEDVESMAVSLERLIKDLDLRKRMGENGLRYLKELDFFQNRSIEKLFMEYLK